MDVHQSPRERATNEWAALLRSLGHPVPVGSELFHIVVTH